MLPLFAKKERAMNLPSNESSIYQNVLGRKQTVIAEIAKCDGMQSQFKQELNDIEGFLRIFRRTAPQAITGVGPQAATTPEVPKRTRKPNRTDLIAAIAIEFLSSGQVLTTNQILERLGERGIKVGGRNPQGNLSSILSKTEQIINSRAAKGWIIPSNSSL
jgi:hypothetical protein